MPRLMGYDSYLGIGQEVAFGTAVQPSEFTEFTSESMRMEIAETLIPSINTTRFFKKRVVHSRTVSGTIDFPVTPEDGIGEFLKYSIGGTITTASTGTTAYIHTFESSSDELPAGTTNTSLTLQISRGGNTTTTYDYVGCKVNQLTLRASVNNLLEASVDMVAKNETDAATVSTASFSTLNPFTFVEGEFLIGDTITAVSTETIGGFELVLGNNIETGDMVRVLGDATVEELPAVMQDLTINITQAFQTSTNYNRFIAGTKSAIRLLFDNGQTAATGATYQLQVDLPAVYFNGDQAPVGGPGVLQQTFPCRAIFDATAGYGIQVKLTNTQINY